MEVGNLKTLPKTLLALFQANPRRSFNWHRSVGIDGSLSPHYKHHLHQHTSAINLTISDSVCNIKDTENHTEVNLLCSVNSVVWTFRAMVYTLESFLIHHHFHRRSNVVDLHLHFNGIKWLDSCCYIIQFNNVLLIETIMTHCNSSIEIIMENKHCRS